MKRLLFLPHSSEPSGAPRVTVDLARRLARRGWEVEMALPTRDGIAVELRQSDLPHAILRYPAGSFRTSSFTRRLGLFAGRILALGRLWWLLMRRRPDLVWIGSSVALPFLLACRMAMVRTLIHVHEHPAMTLAHPLRTALVRRLAHAMVFVGPQSAGPFRPRPRNQPWAILANPMDEPPPIEREAITALRHSQGAADSATVFVCAAYLNPRKDHDTLLRAFAIANQASPDTCLWIVGDDVPGHEGTRARLESLARELNVADCVRFLGARDDAPELVRAGDVCVLASHEEAMPLTIAEAQLAGRPVVSTNIGDIPLMVPNGECGLLVEPGDADGLADAMSRIAGDPDLRRQLGDAGRRRALRLYAADSLLPQFERLVHRVTGH